MKKKALALVTAAIMTATLLAGCAGKSNGSNDKKNDGTKKEQKLVLREGALKTLDSVLATDTVSFDVIQNSQETLLVSNNDVPEAGAAEKWEVSEDGLTWTFKLRDLNWSDGKPVTAKDFEFAWKRLLDPNTGAFYSFFLFPVKNAEKYSNGEAKADEVGIKATDDKTLVVTLDRAVPYFEQIVAFPGLAPQREDIVTVEGSEYGTDPAKLVYSGPFVVEQWQKGAKVVLKKNEKYYNAANIKLEKAELLQIDEIKTAYDQFKAGKLDVTSATGEYLEQLTKDAKAGKYNLVEGVEPSSFYMVFNTEGKDNKALTNAKVRLAFSLVLDREEYVGSVYKRGVAAYGMVPKGLLVGDDEFRAKVEEPLKALLDQYKDPKALLIEGLKEAGLDADPSKHTFRYLPQNSDAETKKYSEYFQNVWQTKLGVKVEIQPAADFSDYLTKVQSQQFDIAMSGWGADYNDPMTFLDLFGKDNGNNNGKYYNEQYEQLLVKVQNEIDNAKRTEIFAQMEKLIIEDAAIAPLFYRDKKSFQQKHVKGVQLPSFGGTYQLRWAYVE
ncbi:MAG: peptide ABC transporter substrate-binding protein [Clostridiales bacterium]|nr:peptide ABC transporter substrate-binding protein [Clostridiales bacterium]